MRRARTFAAFAGMAVTLLVTTSTPADAYPRPGRTERVSVTSSEAEGSSHATYPALSGDGRYVAFHTGAALVPEDTNGVADVYVRDRISGTTERVSTAADGTQGDGDSGYAQISGDGTYVAFLTYAGNLIDAATESVDLVIKDRQTAKLELVSAAADGSAADADHFVDDISPDGRYVLFRSKSDALVAGDTNGTEDVFLLDRATGLTERVSVDDDESELFGGGQEASMSADANLVAFTTIVTSPPMEDLDASDQIQIFVRDRSAGTTSLVSEAPSGGFPNGFSHAPRISRDGSTVAFSSNASNLVPADANRMSDIFVRDLAGGTVERVSVDSAGQEANGLSTGPAISADGRLVVWQSRASNLVPDDTVQCILPNPPPDPLLPGDRSSCRDVFLHDTVTGITEQISIGDWGGGDSISGAPTISADGTVVAFASEAGNLVPSDHNGTEDVFVRHRGPVLGIGGAAAAAPEGDTFVSGWATYSGLELVGSADASADSIGVAAAGTEITSARVVYRHEDQSLLVVVSLSELPTTAPPNAFLAASRCPFIHGCLPGVSATPLVHGVTFEAGGDRWYVSAIREWYMHPPDRDEFGEPDFTLYRCVGGSIICYAAAELRGGYGSTAREIRISAPPNVIGIGPGAELTGVRAFVGVGDPIIGFQDLDSVDLGTATIPAAGVELGVGGAGGPNPVGRATVSGGGFDGRVDAASFPANDRRIFARACLDAECSGWTQVGSSGA